MTYLMTIDSGNTHVKWGLHDGSNWLEQGTFSQDKSILLQQEWKSLPTPHDIIVSNVSSIETKKKLSEFLSCWKIKPRWITPL